ncbi:MAG: diaminopropionate ammonia-lyase [Sphaerochaetaceae bacterium]|jgi:diaminopropionate ammonia-lyase
MKESTPDFEWIVRTHGHRDLTASREMFPLEVCRTAQAFHRQIPGYKKTPLQSLPHLASMLSVGGIYVKDESRRLELNSFKILGGSFAIYRYIQKLLALPDSEMTYDYLTSAECHDRLGEITFASATDGNHGRGVAWAASKLGHKCVIYVHKDTSQARIDAIRGYGAVVKVIDGTYDDAVKQIVVDADKNGWVIISDTSWPGYTEVPTWIMQGYTTMMLEIQDQFSDFEIEKPSHVFVQAGVGALAASVIGFYSARFPDDPPKFIVVEPDKAPCLYHSAQINDGLPHSVGGDLDTIMAGLACGEPSPIAWAVLKECVDVFVQVPDYIAARGMRILATPLKGDPFVISGESGAVGLGLCYSLLTEDGADSLKEALKIDRDSRLLFINTEGNTDPTDFRQIIWDGRDPVPKRFWTQR